MSNRVPSIGISVSKPNKYTFLLDSIFVFFNMSLSGSVILSLLFFYEHGYNVGLIAVLNIIFLSIRFNFRIKIPKHPLFILYVVINILNVITSIITSTGLFYPTLYLVANSTFYVILYNCYIQYRCCFSYKKSIKLIVRGYIWLSILCIFSTLFLFLLTRLGINLQMNDISNNVSVFKGNVELLGHTYYLPYSAGIFMTQLHVLIDVPFFADYGGRICGLCYEPHILTFLIFPALFFLMAYRSALWQKIFLVSIWFLVSLITLSVTNIVTFSFCIAVLLFFDKKWRYVGLIPLLVIIFFLVGYMEDSSFSFIVDKISGNDVSSKNYSAKLHYFAFTPKTLFGTNFFNNNYMHNSLAERTMDVGYIPFLLNLFFLVIMVYRLTVSLLKKTYRRMLSIGILYFFIHSTKIAMATYTQSSLLLVIFILFILNLSEDSKSLGRET